MTNEKFKEEYKKYRSLKYDQTTDLLNPRCTQISVNTVPRLNENIKGLLRLRLLGLNDVIEWQTKSIDQVPGLIYVGNLFSSVGINQWIDRCINTYPNPPYRRNLKTKSCDDSSFTKSNLRWVTMGFHHNWDTKIYSYNDRCQVPDEIIKLSEIICALIGIENFIAEAIIINYYDKKSFIKGHNDISEFNLTAPLISISFGLSAVFLIENDNKEVIPIDISHGDILVMTGPSRTAIHAVPKIIENSYNNAQNINDPFTEILSNYRININIRQVY